MSELEDHIKKLIAEVRDEINKHQIIIDDEECVPSQWIDALLLCDTVEDYIQQANKDKVELVEAFEDAITNLPYMPFEDIPEVQEEYRAIAAKHKEDV